MRKKIFKGFFATVAIVATVSLGSYKAYNSYVVANMSGDNLLIAENIEAHSFDLMEWWNRKDYKCLPVQNCIWYAAATVPQLVKDGTGTVAHTWECITCDDMAPKK